MEYKVLEAPGIEIENVDGAAFNNFAASGRNGIIPGVLKQCAVTMPSSNSIQISTGELLIQGFRIKITEPYIYTFSGSAAVSTHYHVVAKLTLTSDRVVQVDFICREYVFPTQNDLFETESGVYEFEIAKFSYYESSISSLNVTASIINVTGDTYSKEEIDAMFNSYITEVDTLIGD